MLIVWVEGQVLQINNNSCLSHSISSVALQGLGAMLQKPRM